MGLDNRMAIRIDMEALRSEAGSAVCEEADALLAAGQPDVVVPAGGGASGVVRVSGQPPHEAWAGVTADGFTAECDCSAGGEWCAHVVSLVAAALRDGIEWSSTATPSSAAGREPKVARLMEIVGALPARRVALLLAEHAATDRVLETRLLTYAGKLGPLTDAELADARRMIVDLAVQATSGDRWDLHDVEKAGRAIVEEVQVLVQRPATEGLLEVVEQAAREWDSIAVHLWDAWETYEEEPAEIGGALRDAHVHLCEQLQPDPDELAARLAAIIKAAEVDSCLDEPDDYLPVLGRQRVKALRQIHR
jgi:hypothetical protein